jgi:hypothetical protein
MPVSADDDHAPTDQKLPAALAAEEPPHDVEVDVARTVPTAPVVQVPQPAPKLAVSDEFDEATRAVPRPSMPGTDTTDSGVRPGEVLAGKYRVQRVLGVGGMGVVVAARHIQLDEQVALKFLLPEALKNPHAVARFLQEARAAVKIKGEHVAPACPTSGSSRTGLRTSSWSTWTGSTSRRG